MRAEIVREAVRVLEATSETGNGFARFKNAHFPPVALKVLGNQSQSLNCDTGYSTLADELA